MCGIAGLVDLRGREVRKQTIKVMTDAIKHRGPDGEGQWVHKNVGLGHRRLAIIDLTDAASQPMISKDGRFVLTYNGEIYNYKELRSELEKLGVRFYSESDSEVLLNALIFWKEKALSKFNGMFAFALYDKEKSELFLGRDRFGIKPLYYSMQDGYFSFGSEQKAITSRENFVSNLDLEALLEYMTFQNLFTDKTLQTGIKLLQPGHYIIVDTTKNLQINPVQYWDFHFSNSVQTQSEDEYVEELDRLFQQAVKRTLVSDVEIGSYLSGGMDSGSIAAIATLNNPNFHAAELASGSVKVVLSGAGGDELFGGYPWRYYHGANSTDFSNYVDQYYLYWQRLVDNKSLTKMFEPIKSEVSQVWTRDIFESVFKHHDQTLSQPEDFVNHSLYFEAKTFLHGLFVVEDKLSMAHGLETRVPFMDNDLVDFASRVPVNLKVRNLKNENRIDENIQGDKKNLYFSETSDGKYLLRKAMQKYVTKSVTDGAKKGFSSPDASWFRGESIEFVKRTLCIKSNPLYDLLDYNEVQNKLSLHFEGKENKRLLIWSLIYLSTYIGDK